MHGKEIHTMLDLKQNFNIDELIYSYYSGELEIWLSTIDEVEKAEQIHNIQTHDALLLFRLYQVFDLESELSEEEIRNNNTD